jgi:MFS family permease
MLSPQGSKTIADDMVTETGIAASAHPLARWSLKRTFTALRYRNYRLWFIGQLASLIGTWMQTTAQGFLVFQLTNSPAYLGLVGFASGVPSLLFMMFGGVIADRMPRRNLLVVTQTSMMILAFVLATLTFAGNVQPWHIITLSLLLGTANAFDTPARQSFVSELVEREDLGNAIALNSTMFQAAMVVGPALCFTINAISFFAVITALLMMHVKPTAVPVRATSPWQDLRAGLRYIIAHPIIRTVIALVSLTSVFGMSFNVLFPDWAVVVLGGDATTNGWLQSARGVGSLSGALIIASLGRFKFKGKLLTVGSFVFPLALILFALVRALPLSLLTLFIVGWGYMSLFNMGNVLIQTHVDDELRGRVMSVYALAFGGLMPLGALLAGIVADQVGSPTTIVAGALITLALAVSVWWRVPNLRLLE